MILYLVMCKLIEFKQKWIKFIMKKKITGCKEEVIKLKQMWKIWM